jgi:hypothetical protein
MTKITPLMLFYLLFALMGLTIPWYFNLQHIMNSPDILTPAEFFRQCTTTPLSSSITFDLLIGATPAVAWMVLEIRKLKMKFLWLYILGTFLIAFAFTFPLFMFFRELKLAEQKQKL